jgi:hypothetical protein
MTATNATSTRKFISMGPYRQSRANASPPTPASRATPAPVAYQRDLIVTMGQLVQAVSRRLAILPPSLPLAVRTTD